MSGYPEYNAKAFREAAKFWTARGYDVVTPLDANSIAWRRVHGRDFDPATDVCDWCDPVLGEMLAEDFAALCRADAVALLPGWQKSKGATSELVVAVNLGKAVYEAHTGRKMDLSYSLTIEERDDETVCQEAQRLVYGDRGETYGHPLDDFSKTATMWAVLLGAPVSAEQVALCMMALKMSRQMYQPKRDNIVDIAGYAECLQRIVNERKRRGAAA